MNSAHSILPPSKAYQWVHCLGSIAMNADKPYEESDAAREGTAAHWVASEILSGRSVTVGMIAENGVPVDADMIRNTTGYIEHIRMTCGNQVCVENIEAKVSVDHLHPSLFGTCDYFFYDIPNHTLHVWDLKYGWGIVEPFENWQLMTYTAGIIKRLQLSDGQLRVRMHIAQPRPWHPNGKIRTWSVNAIDLRTYFNRIYTSAHNATTPGRNLLKTGAHCAYCRSLFECEASRRACLNAIDVCGLPAVATPCDIGRELDTLYAAQAAINNRLAAIEGQAEALLKSGQNVTDYWLEPTNGRMVWNGNPNDIVTVCAMSGFDIRVPCTPAQARDKGVPMEIINLYTKKNSSVKVKKLDQNKIKEIFNEQ